MYTIWIWLDIEGHSDRGNKDLLSQNSRGLGDVEYLVLEVIKSTMPIWLEVENKVLIISSLNKTLNIQNIYESQPYWFSMNYLFIDFIFNFL